MTRENEEMLNIRWCLAPVDTDGEASILLDFALVGVYNVWILVEGGRSWWSCLPTPLTLASGRSPILWSTSQLLCPSHVDAAEEMMCVRVLQRGHSGGGCDLASTLCYYDLFVLSWQGCDE